MRKRKGILIYTGVAAVTIVLNLIAWNSTAFCDAYIQYIFPIWVNSYGRLTGLLPFSLGEIMLALGAGLVVFAMVLGIAAMLLRITGKARPGKNEGGCLRLWRFVRGFYSFFAWALLGVCLIMTLNCFILYHGSTFSEKYFGEDNGEYSVAELTELRNHVVAECNRLAELMERDREGAVIYEKDMEAQAIATMRRLGRTYDRLDGFYPRPKPLAASDFFCQQYMQGYYFPFSMEANYNDVMYLINKPNTMCHELAHLRGYIFEDEANFISFLACIQSEDKAFQYSGYLSVLNYLNNDLYRILGKEAYWALPEMNELARRDNIFVEEKEWDRINKKALIDTETVDRVSDVIVDATLKANGVSDGAVSYSRVVRLLLQYYRSISG